MFSLTTTANTSSAFVRTAHQFCAAPRAQLVLPSRAATNFHGKVVVTRMSLSEVNQSSFRAVSISFNWLVFMYEHSVSVRSTLFVL